MLEQFEKQNAMGWHTFLDILTGGGCDHLKCRTARSWIIVELEYLAPDA